MRQDRHDWSHLAQQINVASGRPAPLLAVLLLASCCPGSATASAQSSTDGSLASYGVKWEGDRPHWHEVVGRKHLDDDTVASPPRGLHRFLRSLKDVAKDRVESGPLDSIGKGAKKAMEKAKKAAQAAGHTLEKAKTAGHKVIEKVKAPLMKKIDTMRAQMCWTRADLWMHEDCLKFLGLKCKESSTGAGVCSKFKTGVKEHCEDKSHPKAQKGFCDLAKKMEIYEVSAPAPAPEPPVMAPAPAPAKAPDMDGDGIPDSEDPDKDGDGQPNEKDAFPENAKEWADLDGDGIGDNADPDRDGDGVPNEEDKYPDDKEKAYDDDIDDDGVPNSEDVFPEDPHETADLDKDGIGDNADPDIDGDGTSNKKDIDPKDPHMSLKDRDGDGVEDDRDHFPDDPKEWLDSDGDGVGDNRDYAPHDKSCWEKPCKTLKGETPIAPETLNKLERALPSQGYNEHSDRRVEHNDGRTMTSDWRAEWPHFGSETHRESVKRICVEHPDNAWCKRYHRRHHKAH